MSRELSSFCEHGLSCGARRLKSMRVNDICFFVAKKTKKLFFLEQLLQVLSFSRTIIAEYSFNFFYEHVLKKKSSTTVTSWSNKPLLGSLLGKNKKTIVGEN